MNFLSFCHRVITQNADLAFRWLQQARENPDERGLSRAVRSNQARHFPAPDVCFHLVKGRSPLGREFLNEAVDLDQRPAISLSLFCLCHPLPASRLQAYPGANIYLVAEPLREEGRPSPFEAHASRRFLG